MDIGIQNALVNNFRYLWPEMILVGAACVLFLGSTLRGSRNLWAILALIALAFAGFAVWMLQEWLPRATGGLELFAAPVVFDSFAFWLKFVALAAGAVFVFFAWNDLPEHYTADFHACLLIVVAGLSLTASANDLVLLFLSLEMISIPTYVLLYIPRHDEAAQEASIKYFLLSVFSSALLLFGFSYLYGLAGTTNISAILHTVNHTPAQELPGLAPVALILIVAGLGFRITAAPFHFYAPDVFQGAPTVGAAFLAFVPKVAGFAALLRVLGFILPNNIAPRDGYVGLGLGDQVPVLLWFLAAVTMFLGNLLALWQDNLKRLLAYSSVAHAGYMLIALAVAPYLRRGGDAPAGPDGLEALLFYLVAYGAMTIGAFAVIHYLSTPNRSVETVDDLAGLGGTHPGLGLLMTLFLFSLIGIPLTAGFTGKFLVFFGALAVPSSEQATLFRILAFIGVVNAAIAAWYYLRVVAVMYLRTALKPLTPRRSLPVQVTLAICAVLTLALSVPPASSWLLASTRQASSGSAIVSAQR